VSKNATSSVKICHDDARSTLKNDTKLEKLYSPVYCLGMDFTFFSTGQAARELGVAQYTIRALCSGGAIAAECTPGGQWRIRPTEIERLKREGIPALPRPMPGATSRHPPSPPRTHGGLLAEPSEAAISAADQVVELEHKVKAVGLNRQFEEGMDWFRERKKREVERQAELDRQRSDRESQARGERRRREWHDQWLQYALDQNPWGLPSETRIEIQSQVEQVLETLRPDQPENVVKPLMDAAVARALVPWRRQEERERVIDAAIRRLPSAMNLRENAAWLQEAQRATLAAVAGARENASSREMEAAAEEALGPVRAAFEHTERCEMFVLRVTFHHLAGMTADERTDATHAVRSALRAISPGSTDRQMEQAYETALVPFRRAVGARQDRAAREAVLRSANLTLSYSGLSQQAQAKASGEIRAVMNALPVGTAQREVQAAVEKIVTRVKDDRRREETKQGLIERGRREIMIALRKLNEQWEFDTSLEVLERELIEPISRDLERELNGRETADEVANLVRQLVRERT
jgi:hypothetical protein